MWALLFRGPALRAPAVVCVIQIGRGQFTDVHQSGSGNVTLVIQGGF